jgi:hypothetical protein
VLEMRRSPPSWSPGGSGMSSCGRCLMLQVGGRSMSGSRPTERKP